MKYIKVNFTNGDYTETRINGTDKEIIQHYNTNNFFSSDEQVKSIEILDTNIIYDFKEVQEGLYIHKI